LGAPLLKILTAESAEKNHAVILVLSAFSAISAVKAFRNYMAHRTDEEFMQLALAEAQKAAALGETPVGAVLVINGEVVAAAHNMREIWQDPTAHAESIVLREASARLGRWRLQDAALYVTLEPCLMCAGALVLARVGRLVYGCRDPKAGALGSAYDVVRDGRLNHLYRITPGVLEDECRAVLMGFFEKLRNKA
jgi:tRNA(adenine34) deaminase